MSKIVISIWIIITAIICSAVIYPYIQGSDTSKEIIFESSKEEEKEYTLEYLDSINVSQKNLKLDHEYVQYKIIFHNNTNVSYEYFLVFFVTKVVPYYYYISLTDGEKNVMEREIDGRIYDVPILEDGIVTAGFIFDFFTGKNHFPIGKFLFKNEFIGDLDHIKGDIYVEDGTEWFLTMGVYHSSVKEKFFLSLESDNPCMEIIELDRDDKIEYINAWYGNDFDGKFIGAKIGPLGFGVWRDLEKEIKTSKGSVINFVSAFHRRGKIEVYGPDGIEFVSKEQGLIQFCYYGNKTGTWSLKSPYGFGFPFTPCVHLFYMDVDPHIEINSLN